MRRRGPGDASPSKELKHFTDREDEQALFARLLELPAGSTLPVVMFYGVGGTGKSWLLRRLMASLGTPPSLPTALIDFNPESEGGRYRDESSAALVEVRRQLDVDCPRFDLAFAMMRFLQGEGDQPTLKHGGKMGHALDLAKELAQWAAAPVPGGNVLVSIASKVGAFARSKLRETALGRWLASTAGNQDYLDLARLNPQDIYPLLAKRLGEDLEALTPKAPGRACQAVIFLDTFEALRVGVRGDVQQYRAEAWVHEWYRNLTNVLFVIAGCDELTWGEEDPDWRDPKYLEQHLLGGLSAHDAAHFLAKCGIAEGDLQRAVLDVCRDEAATVRAGGLAAYHPYSLGLCADAIVNERASGREPDPATFDMAPGDANALARRFLKSLHSAEMEGWITDLAQTPRFDQAAARAMHGPSGAAQNAAWEALEDYSFLQGPDPNGWYTLHSQMRDALRRRLAADPDALRLAHERWRDHWQSRSTDPTDERASLAWYHGYRLDPRGALQGWNGLAEETRNRVRMTAHVQLLSWWAPTGIEIEGTGSEQEATALNDLGIELRNASLGNRAENLRRAVACFEAALRVYTEADFPQQWAATQNNLGTAYADLPAGDRGENLRRAVACFEAALRVRTEADFPQDWAATQNNLGTAHAELPAGDRAENLRRAVACFEAALRVYAEADFPQRWAATQNNLGVAHAELPAGDRAENLRRAVACYEAALRVRTEADFPQDWAMTQDNLGTAYRNLPAGDRGENLRRAIACYEAALRVRTEADFPQDWAATQNNLGTAHADLPAGDRGENLRRAVACFEAALRVYAEADFPQRWAMTQNNLGIAYAELPAGDRGENLRRAIACYEAALRVRTEADFPGEFAMTHFNLGLASREAGNDEAARRSFDAAVRGYVAIGDRENAAKVAALRDEEGSS